MTGPDLLSLTNDDLVGSFNCTPFQASVLAAWLSALCSLHSLKTMP